MEELSIDNIYNKCFDGLTYLLDIINFKIYNKKKIKEPTKVLIRSLTNKDKSFDEELKVYLNDLLPGYDLNYLKIIMILILVSKSFILNNYDINNDISPEKSLEIIKDLTQMEQRDIIEEFYNCTDKSQDWAEDFQDYLARSYICQNRSMELILEDKLTKEVLRLNPLEMFDINYLIPQDQFLPSELDIQIFLDLYDKTLYEYENNEEEIEDEDNEEKEDEQFHFMFVNSLFDYFDNNTNTIDNFLRYIFSNIYESISITKKNNYNENYFTLIEFLEENHIEDAIELFLDDYDFGICVIDAFLYANDCLIEDDLINRREKFKKEGDIMTLKRLNPYYEAEEIIYAKQKESR